MDINTCYIGIDVGTEPAACALDIQGSILEVCKFKKKKDEFNYSDFSFFLNKHCFKPSILTCYVAIERVRSIYGMSAASNFSFGRSLGSIEGLVSEIGLREGMISIENVAPKDWQKKVIEKILVEDNVILFDDRMVAISDITHFRMYNGSAKGVGSVLSGFGAGWLLFGGIAHFASDNTFTWSTFAIGTTASVLGWILRKFISKKTYKMGKSANLRALDVSFPAPHEVIIQRT